MKNVILLMLLIASVCQVQAQDTNTKKRSWVVGGGGYFSTNGLFSSMGYAHVDYASYTLSQSLKFYEKNTYLCYLIFE